MRLGSIVASISLTCAPAGLFAQAEPAPAPDAPKTKVEAAFLATKGRMLLKEFHDLGDAGATSVKALIISEPGSGPRAKGIVVEVTSYGSISRSQRSFLDVDEVDSAVKALDYIQKRTEEWKAAPPKDYTEANFSTKDDFVLGAYGDPKGKIGFIVSCGTIGKVSAFPNAADIQKIRGFLAAGLEHLNASGS